MAPIFLEGAAKLQDPVERIKYVVCFGFSMSIMMLDINIPSKSTLG